MSSVGLVGLITTALRAFIPVFTATQVDALAGAIATVLVIVWSVAEKSNWFGLGTLVAKKERQ